MKQYRRVTRDEDPAAWKARRYTRAAPGKFRKKKSVTISRTQMFRKEHGGKTKEKYYHEQREKRSSLPQRRARLTRARNKELRDLLDEQASLAPRDSRLIDRYIANGHNFDKLTEKDQTRFRDLFTRYPQDIVRGWLGSSEESRALRMRFGYVPASMAA